MSAQTSKEDSPARSAEPDGAPGAFRALGLIAVCVGVAALAAATFVVSYAGIHAIALQAGIEPRYARGYPLLIDAMLVIDLAAVLVLRGAGLPSQVLAWLTLLVVLAAAAGADALHATGRTLAHNTAAITAAVLPWALVFLAFVLLLTMLRHGRLRRRARLGWQSARPPAPHVPLARPAAPVPPARRAEPEQPEGWQQSQHPADLSHLGIRQPDVIQPLVPQQGPADPVPLPVRTPQPWGSGSIVPGFSRHLASAAAAGAAAGAAEPEADEPTDELGRPDAAPSQDDDNRWAGYGPLPDSAAADAATLPESTELADAGLTDDAGLAYDPGLAEDPALHDDPGLTYRAQPADEPAFHDDPGLTYRTEPADEPAFHDDAELADDPGLAYRAQPADDPELADDRELAGRTELTYDTEPADPADPVDGTADPGPEEMPPGLDDSAAGPLSPAPTTFDVVASDVGVDYPAGDAEPVAATFDDADAGTGETDPSPAQADPGSGAAAEDEDMPVFHRMWSSPTPPES